MPVRNCCTGCHGPMCGPCGATSCCSYRKECSGVGPYCVHSIGGCCNGPCGQLGCVHGAHGGMAGAYYACGHGAVGGCISGLCASNCGPACHYATGYTSCC